MELNCALKLRWKKGLAVGGNYVSVGGHQGGKTAKNGLGSSASTGSVNGNTGNISSDHAHYAGQLSGGINPGAISSNGSGWHAVNAGGRDGSHTTSGVTSNHYHGWAGTTSAPTVSISGDNETRPTNRGVKYIIKM